MMWISIKTNADNSIDRTIYTIPVWEQLSANFNSRIFGREHEGANMID